MVIDDYPIDVPKVKEVFTNNKAAEYELPGFEQAFGRYFQQLPDHHRKSHHGAHLKKGHYIVEGVVVGKKSQSHAEEGEVGHLIDEKI